MDAQAEADAVDAERHDAGSDPPRRRDRPCVAPVRDAEGESSPRLRGSGPGHTIASIFNAGGIRRQIDSRKSNGVVVRGAGFTPCVTKCGRRHHDADQFKLDPFSANAVMKPPRKTEPSQASDELIAVDLALGLLSDDDVKTIERRARVEPQFALSLRSRLNRLAEMARAFGDVEPSSDLWDRIAVIIARLDQQP